MKKVKLFMILLSAALLFTVSVNAQNTPTVFIENIAAPAIGQQVTVPIKIKNAGNIGSVSLKLIFDTSVLDFVSFSGNPNHGSFLTNSSLVSQGGVHDTVSIGWFDTTPLDFTSEGVFVNVNFTYKGGTSNFSFLPEPNVLITDENNAKINAVFIDGKVAPQVVANSSLSGKVFVDTNKNGINDDGGGLQYVTVDLYKMVNGSGQWVAYKLTDASGNFSFTNLEVGDYYTDYFLNGSNNIYTFTAKGVGSDKTLDSDVFAVNDTVAISDTITIASGSNSGSWDAGVYLKTSPVVYGSIGDFVWNDVNGNGFQDSGEAGMPGVTVNLVDASNTSTIIKTTTTNDQGYYSLTLITEGTYKVQFIAPNGYVFSKKEAGGNTSYLGDSNPDSLTGITDTVQIVSGNLNRLDIDAAMHTPFSPPVPTGSIGDFVWNDVNGNGFQDSGEAGMPGVTVNLVDASNTSTIIKATTTNDQGYYSLTGITEGTYKVQFIVPNGYVFSKKEAGGNASYLGDSNPDSLTGITDTVQIVSGNLNRLDIDAAMHTPFSAPEQFGSIGDFVWNDVNKNGIQDNGENGIQGVKVKLLNGNDNSLIDSTITDASGNYIFHNLIAGAYKIQFVKFGSYSFSPKDVNSNNSDLGDSDPDSSTGITDVINLAAGENLYSVDAGMYEYVPQQFNGTIGDFVFNDLNKNGLQDSGEQGIPNVKVKLLNADNNDAVVDSTITDSNGNYYFHNFATGNYKIYWELLSGYAFSPQDVDESNGGQFDSEADPTTGKSKVNWITVGENNITFDAGMYLLDTTPKEPVLTVSITNDLTVVPDSGKAVEYTIVYRNDGTGDLTNATVTDTLPSGLVYVSSNGGISSGETTTGSGIIVFQLGTVAANQNGSLKLSTMYMGHESIVANTVYFEGEGEGTGTNSINSKVTAISSAAGFVNYMVSATNIFVCDTTSGGGGSGVESRGDMAELLLRRHLLIKNNMTTPMVANSALGNLSAQHSLSQIVPATGPYSSVAIETTPFDILGISNATSSYAVDYDITLSNGTRRVAGIFSTVTPAPNIYEHSKAVCDRLAGSQVDEIKLIDINGYKFYAAKFENLKKNIVDYALSFSVYETSNGYSVQNKWTFEEYMAPSGATNVYNFQVWSGSYSATVELVKSILSKFNSFGTLNYLNTNQLLPDTYIKNATYSHDGKIHLTIYNNSGSKQIALNTMYRISQGDNQSGRTDNVNLQNGDNEVVLNTGIISDANVYINKTGSFNDEAYVSGGAYTYINGPNSTVTSFTTTGFAQPNMNDFPNGSLVLSGGVNVAGQLNDWASIVRSLSASGDACNLTNYNALKFYARGSGKINVVLIMSNTQNNNYYNITIDLDPNGKQYTLNFADFRELYGNQTAFDASKIQDVGFLINTAINPGMTSFNFEVKDIAFLAPGSVTGIDDASNTPKTFSLAQNYPNPFNPSTVIQFTMAKKENVRLTIYNAIGQQVAVLVNGEVEVGTHNITFDASNLSSGIYFYKLVGNSINVTKKMILLK